MFSSLRNSIPLRVAASAGLRSTLPKVLVGAALAFGGATVLSAGSASAQSVSTTCSNPTNLSLGDKLVSDIVCGGDISGSSLVQLSLSSIGLTYEFDGLLFPAGGSAAGDIGYTIAIVGAPPGTYFGTTVELDSECNNLLGGSCTVLKTIAGQSDVATSLNGAEDFITLSSPTLTALSVVDSWTTTGTARVTAVENIYSQTSVPGPLPLLGAGMAFGFSRKLRSRIKARVQA